MLLFLPLNKLIRVYLHALSIIFFGLAHHLSISYVNHEQNPELSDPELKLDDLVKLERHAFNFLAQVGLISPKKSFVSLADAQRSTMLYNRNRKRDWPSPTSRIYNTDNCKDVRMPGG